MKEENKIVITEEERKSGLLKKLPNLKAIREERGLTIEDISLKTRISTPVLNAIENSEFHLLPPPVYAKKFIEIYAEVIDVDPGVILDHYQRHVNIVQVEPEEANIVNKQISTDREPSNRYGLYAITVVAIIVIILIMYAFFHDPKKPGTVQHNMTVDEQKKTAQNPAPAVKEQPQAAVPNAPQTPPAAAIPKETTQTPGNAHLDLLIEATEDTWISVAEDRDPPYQTILKAGEKLNRKAQEFFVVDVGNAAGVNVTFLGKPLGKLGGKGQVVHLRLPKQ